ncbi:MAG TPA: hypothetical protein PKJ15_02015 [Methanomassiliicoccales archaeon]|nr:hypothetical protein [Methanomassiliicoccales archaeon]
MHFPSARSRSIAMAMAMLLIMSLGVLLVPSGGQGALTPLEEAALAERYSPQYFFHGDEKLYPVDIETYVTLCDLNMTVGSSHILVDGSMTASELTYYSTSHYLDNRLGNNSNDGIVDYYQENKDTLGYSVYCRVQYSGPNTILQYWTFYYFNDGNLNRHEGDWEMTQVILNASLEPVSTTFSQHESGVTAQWSDVEKDGDHYKVYVARGSHANYYRSYSGALGLANDECGDDKKLTSDDYSMIMLSGSETWLTFMGRWGSNEGGDSLVGQAGPQGPAYRQDGAMWNGEYWSENVSELNTSLLSLELFLSLFVWMYIGILALLVLFVVWRVYRRRKLGEIIWPYLGLLDFKANKVRAASNSLALIALVIGVVAAFLPYYTVSLSIDSPYLTTEGFQDVLVIDGMNGLRVNTLDPEVGLVQLTALPIPLSILLITPLIFLLLGTIGVSDAKIARKYLTRGIVMLLPVIIIIAIIATLSSLYVYFPDEVTGVEDAKVVFDTVSASPFSGGQDVYLPESGETAQVNWGLGIGGYMLIVTSVLLIIAAVLRFKSKKQAYPFEKTMKMSRKWEDIPDVK